MCFQKIRKFLQSLDIYFRYFYKKTTFAVANRITTSMPILLKYTLTDLLNLLPWRKLRKQKGKIREKIAQKRRIMPKDKCAELSKSIVARIESLPDFESAERIMIYYPIHREADIMPLAERHPEKLFYLPVTHRRTIEVRQYVSGDRLHHGRFGIPEPKGSRYRGKLDMIIVPGIAFDHQCNRLGRGGGYYDRFLRHFSDVLKVGVGYDFQLVREPLPVSRHDKAVDIVITDQQTARRE